MRDESESVQLLKYEECPRDPSHFYDFRRKSPNNFITCVLAISIILNLVQGLGLMFHEHVRESYDTTSVGSKFGNVLHIPMQI